MRSLLVILVFLAGQLSAQAHADLQPAPRRVQYGKGSLPLEKITLYIPAGASREVRFALAEFLRLIRERTGKAIKMAGSVPSSSFNYSVRNNGGALPETGGSGGWNTPGESSSSREYYRIDISTEKIRVTANTSAGLWYAVQTIGQLITEEGGRAVLPCVVVEDSPALPFRGVMMDFAHGGLLTEAEILRQIDLLSRWKANQFYFYNEVSIGMEGYATLNYRAAYTPEQIRRIIRYAAERHIEVIPFVTFYGHLHELVRQELHADLAIGHYGHELDPRKPGVDSLIRNWIGQYVRLFESPWIHVGFDETWETHRIAWDADSTVDSKALWLQQLGFVSAELKRYGKTVLAWTDMSSYYPDIIGKMPEGVIPVIWEYAPDSAALYHYLDPVLRSGKKFFIQPAVSGWGHLYPEAGYTYDNIALCLRAGMRHHTMGFITSVWTDAVEPAVRPSWPFMAYGCAAAWQGVAPDAATFNGVYAGLEFGRAGGTVGQAMTCLDSADANLKKCLGRNTSNMPGGTLVESWLNPFDPYYIRLTEEHIADFRQVRRMSEEAEGLLIRAVGQCRKEDSAYINTLLVTAQLVNYSATRFVWAKTIRDRWNVSMLEKKRNDFVFYDIGYTCHGLLIDLLDAAGELKSAYAGMWLSEYLPYRLPTMLGRFDVEYAFWQKLLLKVQAYRIAHPADYVPDRTFEETFRPEF